MLEAFLLWTRGVTVFQHTLRFQSFTVTVLPRDVMV